MAALFSLFISTSHQRCFNLLPVVTFDPKVTIFSRMDHCVTFILGDFSVLTGFRSLSQVSVFKVNYFHSSAESCLSICALLISPAHRCQKITLFTTAARLISTCLF